MLCVTATANCFSRRCVQQVAHKCVRQIAHKSVRQIVIKQYGVSCGFFTNHASLDVQESFQARYGVPVRNYNNRELNINQVVRPKELGIVEDIFATEFAVDRYLDSAQWDQIVNRILGLPFDDYKLITPVTLNSIIWRTCRAMDRSKIGISYSQYVGALEADLLAITPLLRMLADTRLDEKDEEFVITIVNRFLDQGIDKILPDQFWDSARALARTKDWQRAAALVKDMPVNVGVYNEGNINKTLTTVTTLARTALERGDEAAMWEFMCSPLFHRHNVPLRLPLCQGHRYREKVFKAWVEHCFKFKSENVIHREMDKLFNYLKQIDLHLSAAFGAFLEMEYERFGLKRYVVNTKISMDRGACLNCGTVLEGQAMDIEDFNKLKNSVLPTLIEQKDIFATSSPQELKRFKEMLQTQGKFDVVVDGLNVALTRVPMRPGLKGFKPSNLTSAHLLEAVKYFTGYGKRVLVFYREHIKTYPDYKEIKKLCHIHTLDRATVDDPYFIMAALHSGNDCLVVTSDHLRQHFVKLYQMDPELGRLFDQWQVLHQVQVTGFGRDTKGTFTGPPRLLFPPLHPVQPRKSGSHWHIPVLKESSGNESLEENGHYNGLSARWLCVGGPSRTGVKDRPLKDQLQSKYRQMSKSGPTYYSNATTNIDDHLERDPMKARHSKNLKNPNPKHTNKTLNIELKNLFSD